MCAVFIPLIVMTVVCFLLFLPDMMKSFLNHKKEMKQLELEKLREENKKETLELQKAERELAEFDRRLGVYNDENTVLYEDEEYMQRRSG
jgi:uncharacterized membrane protein YgaE (UPF0421/DUF939 family)